MENQTFSPDNQPNQSAVQPPASSAPLTPNYAPASPQPKSGKGKTLLVAFFIILLVVGAAALGYFYYRTNSSLKQKSQELSESYKTVELFQGIIDDKEAVDKFLAQENSATLSRSLCSGNQLGMFDVHLNDSYAVFRYLCANASYPVRIGALKKTQEGTYEFTYGSTAQSPNNLPSYIFNTEPEFFGGVYGATVF
jgi:hypothetical protein